MNIATLCLDCCSDVCPTATVLWESRSASKSKCGFAEFGTPSSLPKRYLTLVRTHSIKTVLSSGSCFLDGVEFQHESVDIYRECVTTASYDQSTCETSIENETTSPGPGSVLIYRLRAINCAGVEGDFDEFYDDFPSISCAYSFSDTSSSWFCPGDVVSNTLKETSFIDTSVGCTTGYSTKAAYCAGGTPDSPGLTDTVTTSTSCALSDEYTTAQLIENTEADLPETWPNSTSGSFRDLTTNELTYSIRESRYRIRFEYPPNGRVRLSWVERFTPESGGVTISDVILAQKLSNYRPEVEISGGGGSGALAVAVMNSSGGIASVRILNPGSGYTSAPTVSIPSSSGWTATVLNGQVVSISGGSAGSYLPSLTFSGGGGSGLAATLTMDPQGDIASVSMTSAGSGYTSAPSPSISGVEVRLSTDVPKCEVWTGSKPSGYDPGNSSTWPVTEWREIPIPETDGTTTVANVRTHCDKSTCP